MGDDKRYCLCCDEEVPINYVERFERREVTCVYCGFVLDVHKLWDPSKVSEGHTLIAEDSAYISNIIRDAIKTCNFSAVVDVFENGLELITTVSHLLAQHATIDVAIIDLNMPVMDGITAARTMRAIEAQHKANAAPIVFFSSMKADESLRAQMDLLQPATYMNKGTDPDPDKLAERVEQLVGFVIEKYKK
jgi:CheY-like chemotaxis protein